jgi:MYXO-CTERM domain-containing protein
MDAGTVRIICAGIAVLLLAAIVLRRRKQVE